MISISKKRWNEISELSDNVLSSKLLKTISLIYDKLDEQNRYAYILEVDFGDFVIHNGTINKKDLLGNDTKNFLEDISYSEDPLALVIHNQIEVYTINRCSDRRRVIKEKEGKKDNTVQEEEYIVPLNTIIKGDFYGVFGTLDYLSHNEIPTNHGMDWFAVAGLNSFIFDFPFFHSTVNVKHEYIDFIEQFNDKNYEYYPGKEQVDFFRKLLPSYKTRVIYFPDHIFKSNNYILNEKLHYHLLNKGWSQYSPLRNISFENKVLSDIVKNKTLNNETEFILKLYDYIRNVFLGNAKILRPLKSDESHFLNEAIAEFKTDCKVYFNKNKKHIKPLCYIYDVSRNVEIGFLSMTNLPLLKNYWYTKLEDVIADLCIINREFIKKDLTNYILDLNLVTGYGGIDNSGRAKMATKGTNEFKKLVAGLFDLKESEILPTTGQFKNTIAITLKKS